MKSILQRGDRFVFSANQHLLKQQNSPLLRERSQIQRMLQKQYLSFAVAHTKICVSWFLEREENFKFTFLQNNK